MSRPDLSPRPTAAALVAVIVCLGVACTDPEIVALDGGSDGGNDAQTDASLDAGIDAAVELDGGRCRVEPIDRRGTPEGCELHLPPARPLCEADDGDVGPMTFVVNRIRLDTRATEGFDLDGFCTNAPDWESDCEPSSTIGPAQSDGPGGIDNAWGSGIYATLSAFYGATAEATLEVAANEFTGLGRGSGLIRVSGWNGEPYDQNVHVTFALGVCAGPPGVDTDCGASEREPLDWERRDNVVYPNDDGFFDGRLDRPRFEDPSAYVTAGRLVARLPDTDAIELQSVFGTVRLGLREARLVATLTPNALLDGFVAGKWPRSSVEAAARGFGICPETTEYSVYDRNLLFSLDTIADGVGGDGVRCNAISVTFGFEARRGVWADPVPAVIRPSVCP